MANEKDPEAIVPQDKIELAREQLQRVQAAWDVPTDWSDLAIYSFYSLENAVAAAADFYGIEWQRNHPSKIEASVELRDVHGLPDIEDLLAELNTLRKSTAYGETPPQHDWSAEDIAIEVEAYVEGVASRLEEAADANE
ncbi:MAG: hypothetical protein ACRDIZ_05875 [Actinomycetota bacterium]